MAQLGSHAILKGAELSCERQTEARGTLWRCHIPAWASLGPPGSHSVSVNIELLHGACAGSFYINLTQARVAGEEEASVGKRPPYDQAIGKPVGHVS